MKFTAYDAPDTTNILLQWYQGLGRPRHHKCSGFRDQDALDTTDAIVSAPGTPQKLQSGFKARHYKCNGFCSRPY